MQSGQAVFALILGVLLTTAASWVVASLYRRRMVALMRGGPAPDIAAHVAEHPVEIERTHGPASFDPAANRRASFHFLLALSCLSLLVGLTQSLLAAGLVHDDRGFSPKQTLMVGAVCAWPMVLGWGPARPVSLALGRSDEPCHSRARARRTVRRAAPRTPGGLLHRPLHARTLMGKPQGLDRFTLRGRHKVDAQWKLWCMVHDIEKLAHHGYGQ